MLWYGFIAGCICLGMLLEDKNAKRSDCWWAFFGGFMLLPIMAGVIISKLCEKWIGEK